MRKTYFTLAAIFMMMSAGAISAFAISRAEIPLPPDTSSIHEGSVAAEDTVVSAVPELVRAPAMIVRPTRLIIPPIALDAPVEALGINERGEMAVPDGRTGNVGWYKYGTVPGEVGSAVFDAHVYAAFKNLQDLAPGSELYVEMSNGTHQRFVVAEKIIYRLEDVPREKLFNRGDGAWLNLITCAGSFDPARDTYDQRLVVYARLAP